MTSPRIAAAEARAAESRRRLMATVATVQQRLKPQNVISDVTESASNASRRALVTTVEAAERQPMAVIGAAAAVIAFLGRHRLYRLFRRKPRNRTILKTFPQPNADTKDQA